VKIVLEITTTSILKLEVLDYYKEKLPLTAIEKERFGLK
jgi:hypothetical protein